MRISDANIGKTYLNNLNSAKTNVQKLQIELATLNKIQSPSDSPEGTAKIINLSSQLFSNETYSKNIQNSLAFMNESVFAMETIQSSTVNALTTLSQAANSTTTDLNNLSDQIDNALTAILTAANSQYDGKYLFGGTDFANEPFALSSDGQSYQVNVSDISGKQNVKIAQNMVQAVNIPGSQIFGTAVSLKGNLNSSSAAGSISSNQTKIYDALGNEYTLSISFQKSSANAYQMSFNIIDSSGNSVFSVPPANKQLLFNSDGNLKTIDGQNPSAFSVKLPGEKIDFQIDPSLLKEKASPESISSSLNQKMDILNTLATIRDNLKKGIRPNEDQTKIVKDFNQKILNKISEAGNVINRLNSADELLSNRKMSLENLISDEKDVDVAKAVTELQQQDYVLQLSYKVSSMLLPKSLVDYL